MKNIKDIKIQKHKDHRRPFDQIEKDIDHVVQNMLDEQEKLQFESEPIHHMVNENPYPLLHKKPRGLTPESEEHHHDSLFQEPIESIKHQLEELHHQHHEISLEHNKNTKTTNHKLNSEQTQIRSHSDTNTYDHKPTHIHLDVQYELDIVQSQIQKDKEEIRLLEKQLQNVKEDLGNDLNDNDQKNIQNIENSKKSKVLHKLKFQSQFSYHPFTNIKSKKTFKKYGTIDYSTNLTDKQEICDELQKYIEPYVEERYVLDKAKSTKIHIKSPNLKKDNKRVLNKIDILNLKGDENDSKLRVKI